MVTRDSVHGSALELYNDPTDLHFADIKLMLWMQILNAVAILLPLMVLLAVTT